MHPPGSLGIPGETWQSLAYLVPFLSPSLFLPFFRRHWVAHKFRVLDGVSYVSRKQLPHIGVGLA